MTAQFRIGEGPRPDCDHEHVVLRADLAQGVER